MQSPTVNDLQAFRKQRFRSGIIVEIQKQSTHQQTTH